MDLHGFAWMRVAVDGFADDLAGANLRHQRDESFDSRPSER
jgi:hypothetical protein